MQLSHHHRVSGPGEENERGYILAMMGLLLVPLLLMVGLSVDVGSWYNRASEIQKAADAAALAGVVWLPNEDVAIEHALEAARKNGFRDGVGNVTVSAEQAGDRQLRVEVTENEVGSFFYGSIHSGSGLSISRSAKAQYVLPVKMGSPENRFGNDPTRGFQPNIWASISAPNARYEDGDPYSTKWGPGQSGGTPNNPQYRDWGYLWAVDVPSTVGAGRTLDVEIYDAGNYNRSSFPNTETADYNTVDVQFEFFRPDLTPLNPHDGLTPEFSMAGRCSGGSPGRFRLQNGTQSGTYRNQWQRLCRVPNVTPGQWMIQVKTSNIPTFTDRSSTRPVSAFNQYSIRAEITSGSVQPTLYAIGDISLFNNLPGVTGNHDAEFYLAEVEQIHAGKTFEISLFDPGDGGSGNYFMNIRGPGNSLQDCRFRVRGGSWQHANGCRIQTRRTSGGTANIYNEQWLDIQIAVPETYECTDCWWTVLYEFRGVTRNNSPYDRTTWSARVIGDPVHLIEE